MSDPKHADAVEGGNYDVIRARLTQQGSVLREAANALNTTRSDLFGTLQMTVLGEERVRTEHKCTPVDIVQVQDALLFGYNVTFGLKQETALANVLSLHSFSRTDSGFSFQHVVDEDTAAFLHDRSLQREFNELYQYYKDARLIQLWRTSGKLLAVFQTGATALDVKVLRWAVDADGHATYIDSRGERDHVFPPTHDFSWIQTTRKHHVTGVHPHVNIEDVVFVETVGGDLTVKVEDNTASGEGIYAEPVLDPNQSLDDADIRYARLGPLVLMRVLPFREVEARYLVYNQHTRSAQRIDAIGSSCVQLPEDQGILFPGGYYLATGKYKVFEADWKGLEFVRVIASPNGEDLLYVFHRRGEGSYALYPYNMIRKEVSTPIHANGYSLFDDGRMVVFRNGGDPVRVHPMQVWQTPFVSAEVHDAAPQGDDVLSRVGNRDLVRGISDALTICRLVDSAKPTREVYEALIAACIRHQDAYFWAGSDEAHDMRTKIDLIRQTAERIVDEFEKVQQLQRRARDVVAEIATLHDRLLTDHRPEHMKDLDAFMQAMVALRTHRGKLISMREVRYVDRDKLDALEAATVKRFDAVSQATVTFLLEADAYGPVRAQLDEVLATAESVKRSVELVPLTERLQTASEGVALLSEVVAGLSVEDPTQKAEILGELSEVFAHANRVRAVVDGRREHLAVSEGKAEFFAQLSLFDQTIAGSLARCDTPEACDEQLSALLLQLEDLEGRFGEFDAFVADIAEKRERVYESMGARKQVLLDARNKRVASLVAAAGRILDGVERRSRTFQNEDDLNAWFASDAMILKLGQLTEQLTELGDTVRSEEIRGRLKTAKQDGLRGLRDKVELFDENNLVKFGKHRFTVNTEPLQLTLLAKDDALWLHLTGTGFHEALVDPKLEPFRAYWNQDIVSEAPDVYRGEYLAATVLAAAESGEHDLSIGGLEQAALSADDLLARVRAFASERYDEGYDRGVHDQDATKILAELLRMRRTVGVLRFPPMPRALALLFWTKGAAEAREAWRAEALVLGRLRENLGPTKAIDAFVSTISTALSAWHTSHGFVDDEVVQAWAEDAAAYLFEELTAPSLRFTVSREAQATREALQTWLIDHGGTMAFEDALIPLADHPARAFRVRAAYLARFLPEGADDAVSLEVAAWDMVTQSLDIDASQVVTEVQIDGLLGRHPRIHEGSLPVRFDAFSRRLHHYRTVRAPAFRAWRTARAAALDRERVRLRLDELVPKVMSSFVRNQLVQDVYLPLVGDNLAKQLGAAGADKRTDLMGLLLLVSPPGYGKTTLMEYVANRLGLVFVKVNGPALGHEVRSLDPSEAPNATARQEVDKINLALELGNNVMLYLDDIQHTHPELLQKFISLCDAQRRIEGVWEGRTRTYDMRGKKFCVVMAGNPYTETGESFQIPDMLANRADTYNLGDVLSGRERQFAMSFIENSVTSNSVLAPLSARPSSDLYQLVRIAEGEEIPLSELSHDYSSVELDEIRAVLTHMFACRDVLLKVNALYVSSAAQEDIYRTEPRFQLQGSYRNMNKLAEKIVPAMTPSEVQSLIGDHYQGEAQTLTTGAESNLLKLAELRGTSTTEQIARFASLREEFQRQNMMGGDDDPASKISGVIAAVVQQLGHISGRLETSASIVPAGLTSVSGELASLRRAMTEGRTEGQAQDQALVTAVQDLAGRVSEGPAVVQKGLVQLARGLKSTVSEAQEDQARMEALAASLQAPLIDIATQIRGMEPFAVDFGEVFAELSEIRALLSKRPVKASASDRSTMMRKAWDTLEGRDSEAVGDPQMVAAVEVIERFTRSLLKSAEGRVRDDAKDAFVDELRRAVAKSVTELAEARSKASKD